MLKQALNALTALHSRPGMLKRLGATGSPDIFTPCRLTPANYFRFLRGPEYTTVKGVEFIIPIDSLTGQFAQILTFDTIPDAGTFKIQFGASATDDLDYTASAANIQTALRLIPALVNVLVTGSFLVGFTIVFAGFSIEPGVGVLTDNELEADDVAVGGTFRKTSEAWTETLKRGDRIVDGNSLWSVDEIIVMHDLGAQPMAYRIRCD